jgi:hypothetical protein
MAPRRQKRFALAAWLGVLALGIQALIPVFLAAEIELAAAQGGKSVFSLCAFGHLHSVAHRPDGPSRAPIDDDTEQGAVCPICIALQASVPFTAPAQIALPLPADRPLDVVVATLAATAEKIVTAAYRSRAPPLG